MKTKDTFHVTKYDTTYTYKQQLTQDTHNTHYNKINDPANLASGK